MSRASKWEFFTSNGGNLSAGIICAEGGSITLLEPNTKKKVVFYYGALGAGPSLGFKLPKLGKITGVTGSAEDFPSSGTVRMCNQFKKSELSISDINGGCSFMEIGAGLAWGKSQTAMLI